MKKLLLLILVGFILTSIIALSFTFQASNSFKGFEGDDNADDDKVENILLKNPNKKLSITTLINKIARENPFINYNLLLKLESFFNNTYIYVGIKYYTMTINF
ncbi:MAG: hypothetical protein ACTSPN_16855 [Promethearchaeota archaeon]